MDENENYKVQVLDNSSSWRDQVQKQIKTLKQQIFSQIKKEQSMKKGIRNQPKSEAKKPILKSKSGRYISPEEFYNQNTILQ